MSLGVIEMIVLLIGAVLCVGTLAILALVIYFLVVKKPDDPSQPPPPPEDPPGGTGA